MVARGRLGRIHAFILVRWIHHRPRSRTLEVHYLPLGRCQLAHYQVHLLPNGVQGPLLGTVFERAALLLVLELQLLHDLLDGVLDEEQGEQPVLALDYFEQVVLERQQNLWQQVGDLAADEVVKGLFLLFMDNVAGRLVGVATWWLRSIASDQLCELLVHKLHLVCLSRFHALCLLLQ